MGEENTSVSPTNQSSHLPSSGAHITGARDIGKPGERMQETLFSLCAEFIFWLQHWHGVHSTILKRWT